MKIFYTILLFLTLEKVYSLPKERRIGFVASTNGGSESFQPLADLLIEHSDSWTVAHAYCSSPGEITNNTVLPSPPFCYKNWTVPIQQRAPKIKHVPIIQMLGNSGPLNFQHPYIFASKYVDWAIQWNFNGYLLDAEFKGDDAAFSTFLNVFADALHAVNKSLGVFLYPDLGKKDLVNSTRADYWLGTWSEKCDTIPSFIWGTNPFFGRGGMMLYQTDSKCDTSGIKSMFTTWNESRMEETSFWANAADMGPEWYSAMSAFINTSNTTMNVETESIQSSIKTQIVDVTTEKVVTVKQEFIKSPLPSVSWNHVPLFAHIRWANLSKTDISNLSTFRSVTVQVEPDAPMPCEDQASDIQAQLVEAGAQTSVLMYGNLYFAEPNCRYFQKVANSPWLWLNDSTGVPVRPAGRYTFDLRNTLAPSFWVNNVLLASNVSGGFGDSGCGTKPSWFNTSEQEAFANAQLRTHAVATFDITNQTGGFYIANCPIVPEIGDNPLPGVNGEMIESWCSDFAPGAKAPANYCRDEIAEAIVQASSPNRTWLQARYYLNGNNAMNPQFGLAAFLIAANEGSFFGASHDWDWQNDWENLLSWPWTKYSLGSPVSSYPNMTDKDGCGWIREYANATASVNFCTKHLYARIDWLSIDVKKTMDEEYELEKYGGINEEIIQPNKSFRNVFISEGACDGIQKIGATVGANWLENGFACLQWRENKRGERRKE